MLFGPQSKFLLALLALLALGPLALYGRPQAGAGSASTSSPHPAGQRQTAPAARCLSYQPSVVRLTGTIVREIYPGPPNYENMARGDRPESFWFLKLSQPICIAADLRDPDDNPEESNIRMLQLALPGLDDPGDISAGEAVPKLAGKRAIATGSLFGAQSPNQHTPVLLAVATLARAR